MSDWADDIEEDLNWREVELDVFKRTIASSGQKRARKQALLRASWLLLYAHYEGFCKFAWDTYFDVLERLTFPRSLLVDEIARLSLGKEFKELRGSLSEDQLWKFCTTEFISLLCLPPVFINRLETNSNLWPSLLKENCEKICFKMNSIDEHYSKLKALVSRRNDIAHGQKMIIKDIHEYTKYEHAVLVVMHELAVNVIDAIENKSYLKAQ